MNENETIQAIQSQGLDPNNLEDVRLFEKIRICLKLILVMEKQAVEASSQMLMSRTGIDGRPIPQDMIRHNLEPDAPSLLHFQENVKIFSYVDKAHG